MHNTPAASAFAREAAAASPLNVTYLLHARQVGFAWFAESRNDRPFYQKEYVKLYFDTVGDEITKVRISSFSCSNGRGLRAPPCPAAAAAAACVTLIAGTPVPCAHTRSRRATLSPPAAAAQLDPERAFVDSSPANGPFYTGASADGKMSPSLESLLANKRWGDAGSKDFGDGAAPPCPHASMHGRPPPRFTSIQAQRPQ